ncbi:MAG: family 10 glycosylhydrolase [Candidatus Latescibacterota bacterium]|nr:family 10 glycosylhydrolase [Candidatus Latescibacterota bacterium]
MILRSITKITGQLGLRAWLLFFVYIAIWPVGTEARQARALWVVRHDVTTQTDVVALIAQAQAAGINTLFVQVRGRGDAYYSSELIPPGENIEEGFDPLRACIELGHKASIEVHAWVNVYLAWYPDRKAGEDHILSQHPEWFMVSDDDIDLGQPEVGVDLVKRGVEGRYLSPANPRVTEHLLQVIGELIDQYSVDGIHLDYVRYPNEHYDFSLMAKAAFWTETGLNAPDEAVSDQKWYDWNRWRSSKVTSLVRRVKRLLDSQLPGAELSAAVKPDLSLAYSRYGQNWVHWVNRRYLDFVVPMFYIGTSETIFAKMQTVRKYVQKGRVYAGLGVWNQGAQDTFAQIELVSRARLDGFSLFSYKTLVSSHDLQRGMGRRFGGQDR